MLNKTQVEDIKNNLIKGKRIVDVHPKQKEVYDDNSQYKIICAGRGFGKTILLILLCLKYIWNNPQTELCIVSPTNDMNKKNMWYTFIQLYNLLFNYGGYSIKAEFNATSLDVNFSNGCMLFFRSGDKIDRLRGARPDWLGIDEFAFITNKKEVWNTVEPSLKPGGQVVVISSPNGYDSFYELWEIGQNTNQHVFKSWQFKSIDNVALKGMKAKAEKAKSTWSKKRYEAEYEAEFTDVGGRICKEFDRDINIVDYTLFPEKPICISTDFNVHCMTSIAFQQITKKELLEKYPDADNENRKLQDELILVVKEWKLQDEIRNVDDICIEVRDYLLSINYNQELFWYGDPHGKATNTTGSRNVDTGKINNNWNIIEQYFPNVILQIDKFQSQMNRCTNFKNKVSNYLKQTGILINKDCKELIKDIETVKYNQNGIGIDKTQEKQHIGHLFDCISYAVSYIWDISETRPSIQSFDLAFIPKSFAFGYN